MRSQSVAFHAAATRAKHALGSDAGKLWGARLDSVAWLGVTGKTMLLSAAPAAEGYASVDSVWSGPLPTTVTPSNSSVAWAGRTWAMMILPLPDDTLDVERLLIHEAMHVLQPSVLPAPVYDETGAGSAVLDQPTGRSWLRLELKALATALRTNEPERDSAVRDALLFRAMRYAKASPDEMTRERALDVKEGIPEYTAWMVSNSPRAQFIDSIDSVPARLQSFIRSFPYYTGPAYAILLDDYTKGSWRRTLAAHPDLQSTIIAAIPSHMVDDSLVTSGLITKLDPSRATTLAHEANDRARIYGGPVIIAEENQRWAKREKQLALYRAKFIASPTVRIRPRSLNISFDPRGQASLDTSGTIMANLVWKSADGASLTAPDGALVNSTWTELRVPLGDVRLQPGTVAAQRTIRGAGWTLVLAPGWTVRAEGPSVVIVPPPA